MGKLTSNLKRTIEHSRFGYEHGQTTTTKRADRDFLAMFKSLGVNHTHRVELLDQLGR